MARPVAENNQEMFKEIKENEDIHTFSSELEMTIFVISHC